MYSSFTSLTGCEMALGFRPGFGVGSGWVRGLDGREGWPYHFVLVRSCVRASQAQKHMDSFAFQQMQAFPIAESLEDNPGLPSMVRGWFGVGSGSGRTLL